MAVNLYLKPKSALPTFDPKDFVHPFWNLWKEASYPR